MTDNCTCCFYYEGIDNETFYCDKHGVCSMKELEPCNDYCKCRGEEEEE